MSAPRELPDSFAGQQEFEIQRVDYAAPEAGGRLGGVQAGFPLWLAVWTLATIGARRSDIVRAWLAGQRGQLRRFYGRDIARPYPLAHIAGFDGMTRAGGGAFAGDATAWSETINSDDDSELTLEGLPAGLSLSIGDYVGFKWDAEGAAEGSFERRALVRVALNGAAIADEDGAITVKVEPPVPSVVPEDAVAHLDRPCCVMTLITDQSKLNAIDRRLAVKGGTIAGLQDLRP